MRARGKDNIPRGLVVLIRPERLEAALWRAHGGGTDPGARQKLFDYYRCFAAGIAHAQYSRRAQGNFDRGDVEQLAHEALIQAIERFDPSRTVPFEAYARIRIKGHIANGLAQTSETAAQRKYQRRAEQERLKSLQSVPETGGLSGLEALSSLSASIAIGLMLETDLPENIENVPDPSPSAYDSLAWNELQHRIHEQIDRLPAREAYVLRQHYRNGVSFQQVATLMGVSKGRVSQIHRAALEKLRSRLAKLR